MWQLHVSIYLLEISLEAKTTQGMTQRSFQNLKWYEFYKTNVFIEWSYGWMTRSAIIELSAVSGFWEPLLVNVIIIYW